MNFIIIMIICRPSKLWQVQQGVLWVVEQTSLKNWYFKLNNQSNSKLNNAIFVHGLNNLYSRIVSWCCPLTTRPWRPRANFDRRSNIRWRPAALHSDWSRRHRILCKDPRGRIHCRMMTAVVDYRRRRSDIIGWWRRRKEHRRRSDFMERWRHK